MAAILDAGSLLIASGVVSGSQDFPSLLLHPRTLPTCHWVIAVTVPPAASALFRLSIATTAGGTFTEIARLNWPAGSSGSKQVPVGVSGNVAQLLNNQAAWVRASITLTGPLTLAGSWLTTSSDGGCGLASRSYSLDNLNDL